MDIVVELLRDGIKEHAVDGEVAAEGVFLGGAEHDGFWMAAIKRANLFAEGSHLDGLLAVDDRDDAEGLSDRDGFWEEGFDLFGKGIGGNIVVLGLAAEQAVPHAASCEKGKKALGLQCLDHLECCIFLLDDFVHIPFPFGKVNYNAVGVSKKTLRKPKEPAMNRFFPGVALLLFFVMSAFAQFGDPFSVKAHLDGHVVRLEVDVPANHYLYADYLKVTDALGNEQKSVELPAAISITDPDTGKAKGL